MKHKLFTTLLVMLVSMTANNAFADYVTSSENEDGITIYYKFINENTELEVIGGDNDASTIRIPNEVYDDNNGIYKPVTSIGDNAFKGYQNLTNIYIPNSIINIGNEVFYGCNSLTSINIPTSVKSIGSYAFYRGNGSPMKLIVEDIASWLEICFTNRIGDFYLYSDESAEINNLVIPSTVTSIGAYCFDGCKNITSITFPETLTTIGEDAFSGCTDLTSIEIPSSVSTIGESAFYGCSKLQTVSFSNGLTSIGDNAFAECFELLSIELPNSLESIGMYAFNRCSKIQFVYIPSNVKEIGINPFFKCEGIQYVSVSPYNLQYDSNNINGIVETSTSKLIMAVRNATIPNRIKIIGQAAFQCHYEIPHASTRDIDCTIILPDGVEEVERYSLAVGLHVGTLRIPPTIKKFGSTQFLWSYVDVLDLADIKAWCETSGGADYMVNGDAIEKLYHDGVEVKELVIPDNTTKIGHSCFANVKNITSVTIPNSVTSIGCCAFSGCSSLTSINIPSSVTSIDYDVFDGCTGLTSVTVEWETPIAITSDVFSNRTNATLYVPRGCKAAYEAADYWKDFKDIKEYGDGNATITMGSSGIMTYSNNSDLNFTGVSGLKAYIASGFNPATGNLTMTRVYEVPAGEGLILKGAANSYEVPYEETSAYYANLLVGVPTATTVSPTDGSYTNFILANDAVKGIGFYPLVSAGEIGPNKAYLQLPTSILPAASRSLRMVFEDEKEDVTGINALNEKGALSNEKFFDLQGRRVVKPTRGLYIKDGKKIMVK